MDIFLDTGEKVVGVEKIKTRDDITNDCRLFFRQMRGKRPTGIYLEVRDPQTFRESDKKLAEAGIKFNMDFPHYIEHHDFVIKK